MTRKSCVLLMVPCLTLVAAMTGCNSPYHADRGALFGGLAGAGIGALVGEAVDNPAAGAIIGAGVGTVSGAAVGASLDEIEARNRALIETQMGREVSEGAVTIDDVVAMSQAGVDESVIVTHIRANGTSRPLESHDLIYLQQNGVSSQVIQAMQTATQKPKTASRPRPAPRPVVVEEHYYEPPPVYRYRYHHHHRHHHRHRRRSGVSWGVSFSSR